MDFQANIKLITILTTNDDYSTFTSLLRNVIGGKDIGEINGTITRSPNKRIFQIDHSSLDPDLRNINAGFSFYTTTIEKSFEIGCTEFRSSTILNESSEGIWNKIYDKYYNCKTHKHGNHIYYSITREKDLL